MHFCHGIKVCAKKTFRITPTVVNRLVNKVGMTRNTRIARAFFLITAISAKIGATIPSARIRTVIIVWTGL